MKLNQILEHAREDVETCKRRDPAARSTAEVLLLYPGLHAIWAYRIAHEAYTHRHFFIARAVSQLAAKTTGIEIHPGAQIGRRFFIDHGHGVVIGETTEIGDDVLLYQGVTLGGTGKDKGKRHPTIGNNVMVGSGAKVLGPLRVGDNTKIAAGAVVLKDVSSDSTAVGVPAQVVRRFGKKVETVDDLDQIDVPDPIQNELDNLQKQITGLRTEMNQIKESDNG